MKKFPIPQSLFDTLEHFIDRSVNKDKTPFSEKDFLIAIDFLKQYLGNKATFEAYRREVDRLIQWSWLIAEKSILTLKRQDLEDYIGFCLKPPKSWIALTRTPRFIEHEGLRIPNPRWRPFVATVGKNEHKQGIKPDKKSYHLSQKALQEIFTILSSFYNYLALEEKVEHNPIALIRQKSKYLQKRQQASPIMKLSERQWRYCIKATEIMANENPMKHERTLFIISALYLLYLRISELAASDRWTPQMNHFYQDSNAQWWFKTVGKGNKMREIAVSDDMLKALNRYRLHLELSPFPLIKESTPLLAKEKGQGAMSSTRHIRRQVQECFDNAVDQLRKENYGSEADALESATVHWLRHTGISDDINKRGRPIAHVRDDAGHSSSAITDRYNNVDLMERYESAKNKKINTDNDCL